MAGFGGLADRDDLRVVLLEMPPATLEGVAGAGLPGMMAGPFRADSHHKRPRQHAGSQGLFFRGQVSATQNLLEQIRHAVHMVDVEKPRSLDSRLRKQSSGSRSGQIQEEFQVGPLSHGGQIDSLSWAVDQHCARTRTACLSPHRGRPLAANQELERVVAEGGAFDSEARLALFVTGANKLQSPARRRIQEKIPPASDAGGQVAGGNQICLHRSKSSIISSFSSIPVFYCRGVIFSLGPIADPISAAKCFYGDKSLAPASGSRGPSFNTLLPAL
jgi:hypothetical protein